VRIVSRHAGFTIVELVITIVLIGIVSSVAIARMLSADAFNAIGAREIIVSTLRMAQQRAIGHEDVVVTLQPVGSDLVISLAGGGANLIPSTTISLRSVSVAVDVDILDACDATPPDVDNTLEALKPLIVDFDALGDLMTAGVVDGTPVYPVDVTTGLRICINNDPIMSICVSKVGYAYAGDCDA
jgi:prepilin-type N-terminal cleavage/methylation domain-containing protein